MSINRIDDLNFERIYPGAGCQNYEDDIEFTKEGIDIELDTLYWEDIKKAYKILFGKELSEDV